MRLKLELELQNKLPCYMDFNYNHKIQANIYKIIKDSQQDYAEFLHSKGYKVGSKYFKYFVFSNLQIDFRPQHGKMKLLSSNANLYFSTPLPDNYYNFIQGVFKTKHFLFYENDNDVKFKIINVMCIEEPEIKEEEKIFLLSPIAVKDNQTKKYIDYRDNPILYCRLIKDNLIHKYEGLTGKKIDGVEFYFVFDQQYVNKKKFGILRRFPGKSDIRCHMAPFHIRTIPELIETGFICGFGINNSLGFGMAEIY